MPHRTPIAAWNDPILLLSISSATLTFADVAMFVWASNCHAQTFKSRGNSVHSSAYEKDACNSPFDPARYRFTRSPESAARGRRTARLGVSRYRQGSAATAGRRATSSRQHQDLY